MYRSVLFSIGGAVGLAAASMFADGRVAEARPAQPVVASAQPADRVDDALAAALIRRIGSEFRSSDVVVQLGEVAVVPVSMRDRELRGSGRLRIDGSPQWVDFDFAALYDTETTEVAAPRLQLRDGGATSAADVALARSLQARVAAALGAEFAGQAVTWHPRETHVGSHGRFLRVSGAGTADFGTDGQVDARVDALYDRDAQRWIRVSYELAPEAAPGEPIAGL